MTYSILSGMKYIFLMIVLTLVSACFAQNKKSVDETRLTETGCVTAAKPFVKMKI